MMSLLVSCVTYDYINYLVNIMQTLRSLKLNYVFEKIEIYSTVRSIIKTQIYISSAAGDSIISGTCI